VLAIVDYLLAMLLVANHLLVAVLVHQPQIIFFFLFLLP
jgi:hypothetical protein